MTKTSELIKNNWKLEDYSDTKQNDDMKISIIKSVKLNDKVDKIDLRKPNNFDEFEKFNFNNTYTNRDHFQHKQLNEAKTKKQHNLIVFGTVLSTASTTEERSKDDNQLIKNIFSSIGIELNDKIVKIYRLNSNKNTASQVPILVQFNDIVSPVSVLKLAKLLKHSNDFKHVSISPDLLMTERAAIQKLIKDRNELNKVLNETQVNGQYYYGIRSNQIVLINKNINKATKSLNLVKTDSMQETVRLNERIEKSEMIIQNLMEEISQLKNDAKQLRNSSQNRSNGKDHESKELNKTSESESSEDDAFEAFKKNIRTEMAQMKEEIKKVNNKYESTTNKLNQLIDGHNDLCEIVNSQDTEISSMRITIEEHGKIINETLQSNTETMQSNQLMMTAQNLIMHNYFKQIAKGFNFQNDFQIENLNDKMKEIAKL